MKETGVMFKADLVLAIKDGRKRVTRRPIQHEIESTIDFERLKKSGQFVEAIQHERRLSSYIFTNLVDCDDMELSLEEYDKYEICPYGGAGDLLYVKETWGMGGAWAVDPCLNYRADGEQRPQNPKAMIERVANGAFKPSDRDGWRSSMFMPKWAARFWLPIVSVRPEKLLWITEEDAKLEGVEPIDGGTYLEAFGYKWRSIHPRGKNALCNNPWVWRIEFSLADKKMEL